MCLLKQLLHNLRCVVDFAKVNQHANCVCNVGGFNIPLSNVILMALGKKVLLLNKNCMFPKFFH